MTFIHVGLTERQLHALQRAADYMLDVQTDAGAIVPSMTDAELSALERALEELRVAGRGAER